MNLRDHDKPCEHGFEKAHGPYSRNGQFLRIAGECPGGEEVTDLTQYANLEATDPNKLRMLAEWFDVFDAKMPPLVEALVDSAADPDLYEGWKVWTGDDAVQRDLRRMADAFDWTRNHKLRGD